MPFWILLVWSEIHTYSTRIWTGIAGSVIYDDKRYATSVSTSPTCLGLSGTEDNDNELVLYTCKCSRAGDSTPELFLCLIQETRFFGGSTHLQMIQSVISTPHRQYNIMIIKPIKKLPFSIPLSTVGPYMSHFSKLS